MNQFPKEILQRLEKSGVVAGFSVEKVEHAVPLTRALLAGGIDAIELTLRTPATQEAGLPFAPGISTPSDLEAAIELGCRFVKFFPAEASGGVSYLRSMSAPYKHLGIRYFPLGGLNAANMLDYLKEDNVPAIGGSWIVKNDLVKNEDWDSIAACATEVRQILEKGDKNV